MTYEEVVPQCGDVREMTDKNLKAERELNYKCLMVIIENLQYLSRQGQPFREHNDCESNFYHPAIEGLAYEEEGEIHFS